MPWYFKQLFDSYYADKIQEATWAFVRAVGALGDHHHDQHEDVIDILKNEEPNLLYAHNLAKLNGWLDEIIGIMQGLRKLYNYTGRRVEWACLVEDIVPYFVDTTTDKSITGLEEQ